MYSSEKGTQVNPYAGNEPTAPATAAQADAGNVVGQRNRAAAGLSGYSGRSQSELDEINRADAAAKATANAKSTAARQRAIQATQQQAAASASRGAAYAMAEEASRKGETLDPYVLEKARQQGWTGASQTISKEASRQTVPIRNTGEAQNYVSVLMPGGIGSNFYVPYGSRAQTEVQNAKAVYSPGGELSLYQTRPARPGFTPMYGFVTSGGGLNSLQSGMFSVNKPLTPIVYTQESAGTKFAPSANPAAAIAVLANPGGFSRLGAEAYNGQVQRIDNRTLGNAQLSTYPASTGNLAGLVNPTDVNRPKNEIVGNAPWGISWNSSTFQSVDQKGKLSPVPSDRLAAIGFVSPQTVVDNHPQFANSANPAAQNMNEYLLPEDVPRAAQPPSGRGIFGDLSGLFGGMFPSGGNAPAPQMYTNTTTFSGSNQTIRDKLAWLKGTQPRLENMRSDIETRSKGNAVGGNWTGTPEGYADISTRINDYNTLNNAFKANTTEYNRMDAENPQVITVTSMPNVLSASPQKDMFQNATGFLGSAGIPQSPIPSGSVAADANSAAWVQGKIKTILGGAGIVGATAFGYGGEAGAGAFATPELAATLGSNPVGWGLTLGGLSVFAGESSGRLGLTGETKDYSVRTAGKDYQNWLDTANPEYAKWANAPINTGLPANQDSSYDRLSFSMPALPSLPKLALPTVSLMSASVPTPTRESAASTTMMSVSSPSPMSVSGENVEIPTFAPTYVTVGKDIFPPGDLITPSPVTPSTGTPTDTGIGIPFPVYTPRVSPYANLGGTNLASTIVGKPSVGTDISNIDLNAVNLNRDVIPGGTSLYFMGDLGNGKQLWTTSPEVAINNGGTVKRYVPQRYLRGYIIGGENSEVILSSQFRINMGAPSTLSQQSMFTPIVMELQADSAAKAAAFGDMGIMGMDAGVMGMGSYDMGGLGFQQIMDTPEVYKPKTGIMPPEYGGKSKSLFNGKLSPLLMGSGEGMYGGSEVPTQKKSYSEISPFKSAYSERPNNKKHDEVPAHKRSVIEIFDRGTPWETNNKNRNKNANKNENRAESAEEFVDAFGVSYPTKNPNKNPTSNPTVYPFAFNTDYPNKNPNKTEFPNETPFVNPFGNPFAPKYSYDFEYGRPLNPEGGRDFEIPKISLPRWGLPGNGIGSGEGMNLRNLYGFREHSPTISPSEMSTALFTGSYTKNAPRKPLMGNLNFTAFLRKAPASQRVARIAKPVQRAQARPVAQKRARPQMGLGAIMGKVKQAPVRVQQRVQPRAQPMNFSALTGVNIAKRKGKR